MWGLIMRYLTFTRKERYGVLFLLVLISALFVLPYMCRPVVGNPDPAAYEKMKDSILKFEAVGSDSSVNRVEYPRYNKYAFEYSRPGFNNRTNSNSSRFHYRSAGAGYYAKNNFPSGSFRKADSFFRSNSSWAGGTISEYKRKKFEPTSINQADTIVWSQLPGIGAKLASRIVHFREKLGGFYQIDQVGETFGLPDSTYQKIKPCLRLDATALIQIDLNSASKESLQAHPYIRWQIANAIINYRQAHGGFHSVDELLQLAQIDTAKFEKLKPYLVVKP